MSISRESTLRQRPPWRRENTSTVAHVGAVVGSRTRKRPVRLRYDRSPSCSRRRKTGESVCGRVLVYRGCRRPNEESMAKQRASLSASRTPSTGRKSTVASRPSQSELYAMGKSLREKCARSSHAFWKAPRSRADPVRLLEESNKGRLPELIPIRHGRLLRTPFTFYRGAALNMAADLAATPATGLRVLACGDCHLMNFGDYATPERRIIF